MRRLLAILLVAWFGFALITPAVLASDDDESLPTCCRRTGKHHCAMMMSEVGSFVGPSFKTARCPLFPNPESAPANPVSTFPPFGIQTTIAFSRSSAVVQPNIWAHESVYDPATPKRGPPVQL